MRLEQGDCLEIMRELPEKSISAIVTDPPYFLPARHYNTRAFFRRNFADLGLLESFFKLWFEQAARVLKDDGHLYIFCDGQSYPLFWFHGYPYTKSVRPLIWDKKTSINGYGWRHQHELILFGEMPLAAPIPTGDGDILRFAAEPVAARMHPAQKPVDLLSAIIAKCGGSILDPFMGSGSTGVACKIANKDFIGIELDPDYFAIAKQRLESEAE